MPTTDFYLAVEENLESSYKLVCKLVDKAYQQKRGVFILANNEAEAKILDDLLWIFKDDGFIPHSLYGQSDAKIQIGYGVSSNTFNDIFLNLTPAVPEYYQQFQRILEIVPQDQKEIARKKYRFYKDNNCEVTTHDLSKS